jgi:hypothetical protein
MPVCRAMAICSGCATRESHALAGLGVMAAQEPVVGRDRKPLAAHAKALPRPKISERFQLFFHEHRRGVAAPAVDESGKAKCSDRWSFQAEQISGRFSVIETRSPHLCRRCVSRGRMTEVLCSQSVAGIQLAISTLLLTLATGLPRVWPCELLP